MSNARLVPCTLDAYHKDTSTVSHSGLELVLEDVGSYESERLSGNAREKKRHYEQGQSLEDALLRPGPCGGDMIVIPDEALANNKARAGEAWRQFQAEHKGKVLVKETDDLYHWIRAVQNHPEARRLIEAEGRLQETIYWTDDASGVDCRLRMDKIFQYERGILDLKTCREVPTDRVIKKLLQYWGYARQAEFYRRGVKELYDTEPPFVFLFVSKVPPYRVEARVLTEKWYPLRKIQNDRALAIYARCLKRKLWLPESHGKLIEIDPPEHERDEFNEEFEDDAGTNDPTDRRDAA